MTGTAKDGELLTAADGTWSGTPPAFARRWRRCDGAACADIAGATASTYRLTSEDVGRTIRVAVTATNAAGSAGAESAPTATVAAMPRGQHDRPVADGRCGRGRGADLGHRELDRVDTDRAHPPLAALHRAHVHRHPGRGRGALPARARRRAPAGPRRGDREQRGGRARGGVGALRAGARRAGAALRRRDAERRRRPAGRPAVTGRGAGRHDQGAREGQARRGAGGQARRARRLQRRLHGHRAGRARQEDREEARRPRRARARARAGSPPRAGRT